MITELTAEQKARMPFYIEKWRSILTNTEPFTQEDAERIVNNFQREVLGRPETPVIVCDNPVAAWNKIVEITKLPENDRAFIYPYQDGSFSAHLMSYYDYFISEKIAEISDKLKAEFSAWIETSKLGLMYPLMDICVVSQKPTEIHLDSQRRLHNEKGMALKYKGYGFYSLNGVTVPEYLVMTDADDLKIEMYLKETNADIKAEFVRKFGVERMLDMGTKVDDYTKYDQEEQPFWYASEYELWDMHVLFDGLPYQPYLKMKNQTTGIWHVEAVSPACRTLSDAIKERFGGRDLRIVAIA